MYEEFYNLSAKPFQLTPDHKFFFTSKVHGRAMAYLRYGLEQGEGFVVITGAPGSGKTMLVRNLFQELDGRQVTAAQLVTTHVEPDDMLRMVCASFGLAHEGLSKAALLHHLEAMAIARCTEGKRVLLVVDEAHNLPPRSLEELRMLANFQVDGRALFQTFLLGQDQLEHTLQQSGMEQIRQRIVASYHLGPLAAEEIQSYVELRLGQVGWHEDPVFESGIYPELYRLSDGNPRLINTLCDGLLLHGSVEQLHTLDGKALISSAKEGGSQLPSEAERAAAEPRESRTETTDTADSATPAPPAQDELLLRVEALEQELAKLKQAMQQDRKLLRRAVLLQLETNEEDDLG